MIKDDYTTKDATLHQDPAGTEVAMGVELFLLNYLYVLLIN